MIFNDWTPYSIQPVWLASQPWPSLVPYEAMAQPCMPGVFQLIANLGPAQKSLPLTGLELGWQALA